MMSTRSLQVFTEKSARAAPKVASHQTLWRHGCGDCEELSPFGSNGKEIYRSPEVESLMGQ